MAHPFEELNMEIGDLCSRQVYVATRDEPLAQAVQRMHKHHVGSLIIVELRNGRQIPVGIVTDRDVLRGQLERRADLFTLNVSDVMTSDPLVLPKSTGIAESLQSLHARGVRRAPVIDATGSLIGIVTLDDLLPAVARELNSLAALVGAQAARELR
jgi:CBS domain-containing protein